MINSYIFQYLINSDPVHISSQGAAYVQEDLYDITMTTLTYENNIHGLISCYIAGLPFLKNSLISTIFYTYLT